MLSTRAVPGRAALPWAAPAPFPALSTLGFGLSDQPLIFTVKVSLFNFLNLGLQFLHTFYMYLEDVMYIHIDIRKKSTPKCFRNLSGLI